MSFADHVPAQPDEPLLERDAELRALGQRIAALGTAGAMGGSVLLSGEPGIGKTTLLRAAARRAEGRVDWLWGTCEPMLSPTPLGPLIDWLDRMPPSLADAVCGGGHSAEVLAGVLAMLRDSPRPVVLVVDDAQWADGATLDLLRYLGRRIESTRALLILAHRDDALGSDHPLLGVLSGLPSRSCTRMALSPLSPAGVAEMARLSGRSPSGLHEITQGNPFFVTELLAGDAQSLPVSVREAVLARIAPLSSGARALIELASVSPTPIETEVLEGVAGDARTAIAACTAAGLLRSEGGALRFRHELARRAIEATLGSGRAAELHAAVFEALRARGASRVRLVHHAAQAGLSAAVLDLAPQAAREAAQASAHRQAAALYALALEHATELPLAERAALHVAHSLESQHVQRVDDALISRRTALAMHRQIGDRLGEGRDLCELAGLEAYRAGSRAALPHVHAAIEVLEGMDAPVDLAVAYAAKAQAHLLDGTSDAALDFGRKALALLEGQSGGEDCLAYALNTVASAQLRTHDIAEAWPLLERSRDIALAHGFDSHAARAYLQTASLLLIHRRFAEAELACERGLAFAEAHDLDIYRMPLNVRHGHALLETGRWQAAEARIAALQQSATLTGLDVNQSMGLQRLIDLRRGNERSQSYWNGVVESRQAFEVGSWFSPLPVVRCEAAWLQGDDAAVRRIAEEAMALALSSGEGWRIGQLACWLQRAGGERPTIAQALPEPCRLELEGDLRGAAQAWARLDCEYMQALVLVGGDVADLRDALALLEALGAAPAARIARRRLRAQGVRDVQRGRSTRTRVDPLGLTTREREVLELLAQRLSNRAIAERLHRSERTVENHVAALLVKLGVSSRAEAVKRAGLGSQN